MKYNPRKEKSMSDQKIQCIQCNRIFVFPAEQRKQFMIRGFDPPTRCPECRKRKAKMGQAAEEGTRKRNRNRKQDLWKELYCQ